MPVNVANARQHLRDFDFSRLFIEELGWDCHASVLDVQVEGHPFSLVGVAHKRGMAVFQCKPANGGQIPDYPTRRKIDHQVTKSAREHLIVYTDAAKTTQVWQWVKRELGKPTASREHTYQCNQPGDALIQKLDAIAFSLAEEEGLGLTDVVGQVRVAFDVERVTRRFYDLFKAEHASFLGFLKGVPDEHMQRWYVSIMLDRLMFIYFIQKKGFLDGADPAYLRTKLDASKARGRDLYYRQFLCSLFFEGFAKRETERSAAANDLLGVVPYLNGGLFLPHQVEERYGQAIQIADAAFDRLFDFFEQYQWHLDERPLRRDNEINPDVLGYIFEKYINQKQMGAYYTKEDITGYISRNTVIPFLFDAALPKCKIAFEGGGGQSVWGLLAADPDRYIYPAVRQGVIDENGQVIPEAVLPAFVRKGMADPKARMLNREYNLSLAHIPSTPSPCNQGEGRGEGSSPRGESENLALPTETWREYVERRKRCLDLRAKLARGKVRQINDLITLNLDIQQFAQDVIQECEGPELLRAFWHAIAGRIPEKSNERIEHGITVLDPTCGSGAFLFAALNILEPLYEARLDRMQSFVDELDILPPPGGRVGERGKHRPEKSADFRRVLAQVADHPNRKYFIYKSIVVNNLFGVDIMDEAVEICKLRLFLKLVAQVDDVRRIEPLPDIDFNIRAGNTLVGYASLPEIRKAFEGQLAFADQEIKRIEEQAGMVEVAFELFRRMQTQQGMRPDQFVQAKANLRKTLATMTAELDQHLAADYGISTAKIKNDKKREAAFAAWRSTHQPFHWLAEFYGIIRRGGFDVIIGNPPYVEYRKVRDAYQIEPCHYETESAENLYAFCLERSADLLAPEGRFGMIVPSSTVGLDETLCLRNVMLRRFPTLYVSTYSIRPSKLFDGVDQRLCILVGDGNSRPSGVTHATHYIHWSSEERPTLFPTLHYSPSSVHVRLKRIAQVGAGEACSVLEKLERHQSRTIGSLYSPSGGGFLSHYHRSPRYWIRSMDFEQYFKSETRSRSIHHFRDLHFIDKAEGKAACAIINSTLFFFWFMTICNGRNLTGLDVSEFPVGELGGKDSKRLDDLFDELMKDYQKNSFVRQRADCEYQEFRPSQSKPILDQIDAALAKHYGLTDEELDFVVNYDIKYRMGLDSAGEGEE